MLIYHPAFDVHHCIFRILRLLLQLPNAPMELLKIRILDFYLLFPAHIGEVQFPVSFKRYAVQFRKLDRSNKYNRLEDPRQFILRLENYQMAAIKCLASCDLIDGVLLSQDKIRRTDKPIDSELVDAVKKSNSDNLELMEVLTEVLASINLSGAGGLKQRTNLFEYRYDAA